MPAGPTSHLRFAAPALAGALLAGAWAIEAPLRADSALTPERTVTELAPGVYTIRHKDPLPGWVNGNTTVVIGTRDVLVVDATAIPASAEEDIAQIRTWTDKPVRYLVNTHWHQDHNGGNAQYRAAFPGVAILAHRETKAMLDATSPFVGAEDLRQIDQVAKEARDELKAGKTPEGKPLSDRRRQFREEQLTAVATMVEQVHRRTYEPPNVTFEDELVIDLGGRQAIVRHPGRGNTGGDLVVLLPQEKILVTGDLLVHPTPYTFDGYPSEWIRTLEALASYDVQTFVPGHGEVLRDRKYLLQIRDLLRSVVTQVETVLRTEPGVELDMNKQLEAIKKKVDVKDLKQQILGDDTADAPQLDYAVDALIDVVFHEAKLR